VVVEMGSDLPGALAAAEGTYPAHTRSVAHSARAYPFASTFIALHRYVSFYCCVDRKHILAKSSTLPVGIGGGWTYPWERVQKFSVRNDNA
jgi:hypothetical protein